MNSQTLSGFFDELQKIAFTGALLKSPIAKQLVTEHQNLRAAKGIVIPPRKSSSLLSASRASRPSPPVKKLSPESSMLAKLQANMRKPSGAKAAADADRVAAAGRGYGRAITSVE
jgi:hypothetical protein